MRSVMNRLSRALTRAGVSERGEWVTQPTGDGLMAPAVYGGLPVTVYYCEGAKHSAGVYVGSGEHGEPFLAFWCNPGGRWQTEHHLEELLK